MKYLPVSTQEGIDLNIQFTMKHQTYCCRNLITKIILVTTEMSSRWCHELELVLRANPGFILWDSYGSDIGSVYTVRNNQNCGGRNDLVMTSFIKFKPIIQNGYVPHIFGHTLRYKQSQCRIHNCPIK